jgi:hypothetical protein
VKEYDEFISLLNGSRLVVFRAAAWLHKLGFAGVRILPASTTPDEASRFAHTDLGDIEITQRIEVKHWPDIDFHSLAEVPYAEVIVDEVYKLPKHLRKTHYGYLIVNKSETACLFIGSKTMDQWHERELFDKREGAPRKFMLCPKGSVVFCRMR